MSSPGYTVDQLKAMLCQEAARERRVLGQLRSHCDLLRHNVRQRKDMMARKEEISRFIFYALGLVPRL